MGDRGAATDCQLDFIVCTDLLEYVRRDRRSLRKLIDYSAIAIGKPNSCVIIDRDETSTRYSLNAGLDKNWEARLRGAS